MAVGRTIVRVQPTWQWIWVSMLLCSCSGGSESNGGGAQSADAGTKADAAQEAGDDEPGDDEPDDDEPAAEEDAGAAGPTKEGGMQDRCAALPCANGQRCDASGDIALCVPSCDGVNCQAGYACEVVGDVGKCTPNCAPRCGAGQRCEVSAQDGAHCLDNNCAQLDCKDTEACVPASAGTGSVCVDNRCSDDLGCAMNQSCQQGVCVSDTCEPGVRTCQGASVRECLANGSGTIERVACVSAPDLMSSCVDRAGVASCSCRDDWDCPAYTNCEQGTCVGTGRAPTCLLPPLPFASLLPAAEPGFPWGGDDADGYDGANAKDATTGIPSRDAKGAHPFRRHAQVSATPIVANLDDDNGDGRVDERDRPEIIFTGFCHQNYFNHGVLRALHGGGTNAGKELFARCGSKLWREGDAITDSGGALLPEATCGCDEGDLEPTGAVAVGDLDREDGLPEIVVLGHPANAGNGDVTNTRVLILSNTGELISDNSIVGGLPGADPAVTLADLDGQGYAEIIVGARVFTLAKVSGRLTVQKTFVGDKKQGINNGQGAVSCAADLDADGRMEIVAGGTAYKLPRAPSTACPTDLTSLDPESRAYCESKLWVFWDKDVEGFCAVADVLSAPAMPEPPTDLAHPLDGKPEVVLISNGHLRIFDGLTGNARVDVTLAGSDGGPPNVDDFDGDGFPEIGTAFATAYAMHDLQPASAACPAWNNTLDGAPNSPNPEAGNPARTPPSISCVNHAACGDTSQFACSEEGSCVCLHNAWKSTTQDASSRVTGSSVFDFNGDGTAEVVYNDECYFRIYEGKNGRVYQRLDSQSPTRIEYPVVADVDSDGNAEIVFSGSNARSEKCANQGSVALRDGINVIGDPTDRWVSARRIWNQHAYHVTNVLEEGTIPSREVANWRSYGGRSYNVYRSNLPPFGHVAPDLTVLAVQVSSPNVVCGEALSTDIRIAARVGNVGDLRVGANVGVRFVDQADQLLGMKTLGVALEPGAETFVSLDYHAPSLAALPTRVKVLVDADQAERECNEGNNQNEAVLTVKQETPELTVSVTQLNTSCPKRLLRVSVKNEGQASVPSTSVRLFAGNPSEGGVMLSQHTVGPIAAGASANLEVEADSGMRDVTVYAVVDAERKIVECNDGNNTVTSSVKCQVDLY